MWFLVFVIIFGNGESHYFVNREPYYNVQQCEHAAKPLTEYVEHHVTPKPMAIYPGCIRVPEFRKS